MAWTDQCKIQAVITIEKTAKDKKLSIVKAIAEVSKESDIPAATLDRWFYPREKKSYVKSDVAEMAKPVDAQPIKPTIDMEFAETGFRATENGSAKDLTKEGTSCVGTPKDYIDDEPDDSPVVTPLPKQRLKKVKETPADYKDVTRPKGWNDVRIELEMLIVCYSAEWEENQKKAVIYDLLGLSEMVRAKL